MKINFGKMSLLAKLIGYPLLVPCLLFFLVGILLLLPAVIIALLDGRGVTE